MTIADEITTIIQSLTDNNIPPQIVTIQKGYNKPICDITTSNNTLRNIRCSGLAIPDTTGLLIYENGDEHSPFVILFTDAETIIHSLGLGLFTIDENGDLTVELPNSMNNIFTINEDGDLTVTLEGTNNYSINTDGDCIYDR